MFNYLQSSDGADSIVLKIMDARYLTGIQCNMYFITTDHDTERL